MRGPGRCCSMDLVVQQWDTNFQSPCRARWREWTFWQLGPTWDLIGLSFDHNHWPVKGEFCEHGQISLAGSSWVWQCSPSAKSLLLIALGKCAKHITSSIAFVCLAKGKWQTWPGSPEVTLLRVQWRWQKSEQAQGLHWSLPWRGEPWLAGSRCLSSQSSWRAWWQPVASDSFPQEWLRSKHGC